MTIKDYLYQSADLIKATADAPMIAQVDKAIAAITEALRSRKGMLVCGNGGSASDAQHIAGELVGRFLKERPAQKCIALTADSAVLTAWSNDYGYETVFSRQVEAYGEPGGVLFALSTSGNSPNVIAALAQAKKMGMTTIALTGQGGGKMAGACDILLDVPSKFTPHVQQVHSCLYHYICQKVEENLIP